MISPTGTIDEADLLDNAHLSDRSVGLSSTVWLRLFISVVRTPVLPHDHQMVTTEEDRLIGQVVDRLLAQFPQVPPATVEDTVGSVHHRFDDAPIRDFVPLFVERHTKDKLANLAGAYVRPA
ncbi:MAG: hypothetical protein WBO08_13690 [Mycobacterium sp.]|nr:hypothetical protein [Mycobacterium sp.]